MSKEKLIVHVLRAGRPLCNMPGVPRDWPDEHRWVSENNARVANCPTCVAALNKTGE